MANLLDAIFFTILVASAGLGVTSIIMAFTSGGDTNNAAAKVEGLYENIFFGVSGLIIALLMWVALVF
ncbi:hypothetical protein CWE09_00665 [Aliidiomarina minuta]|uniref:Uncharacterized protein n=1 Tax=Aliidiomarina minuta TaxID=880057 RepID=A0A432W5D9_9GAMM|nr:hypothetical protein [Aliidiomarina minuta]RUO25285.1 hypothetical protein CWE09_00665 [Aliidiomarina minuta]